MKNLRLFYIFTTLLFVTFYANGQIISTDLLNASTSLQIDSIFTPIHFGMNHNCHSNHIWLASINNSYVDTTKNHINAAAVPAFYEIKNKGLFGPHHVKKQMEAGMYYHPLFFRTMPSVNSTGVYNPVNKTYEALPYGYSYYTIKATASPYFILPKY
jgi:hypothetical protein